MYPETETGSSLLGLLPTLPYHGFQLGQNRMGTDFLLQAMCLPKPTNHAWSLPSQESGAMGATSEETDFRLSCWFT